MKKIQRNEMKKVNGGYWPTRTFWNCTGDGTPISLCNDTNPEMVCFNTGTCVAAGTCTSKFNQCPLL